MRAAMTPRKVAPLLFGSGLCALVYQIAWLRELRMVFGASTAATAAVLAIFIGGLGAGGLVLGKRADRHPRPIVLYARLETLIAASAAVTPLLLWVIRRLYIAVGGTHVLGLVGGTIARLLLSAIVLVVPTFLMGGTLPAAARGVTADDDTARRSTGLLYGVNTLGAVTGCLLANFWMLEMVGTRMALWLACAVNALVAGSAMLLGRNVTVTAQEPREAAGDDRLLPAPAWFALTAAAVVGFAFFLMEMVWYRMLGPILGGTVFTFGLILAVALLGIGLGGGLYALLGERRPASLNGFAYTCLLEAAFMALPYALGDRIATLTLLLRPLGALGFDGLLSGWAAITVIVVLPAAFVSGVQFPMLIALLGRGRTEVGRQIGLAYAFNTVGAIAGSLAGGFGLLPRLSAPGCWRLAAWVLTVLGLGAVAIVLAKQRTWHKAVIPVALAFGVAVMVRATGPTAVWRHSPIGVGRVDESNTKSRETIRAWMNEERRAVVWERDGVESSVALNTSNGWAFVVNGKIDGNARGDAPTQVMGGLVGAILHPNPKSAMVVGLGTGSTAGWLGAIPSMETVDVVELEPSIRSVAEVCVRVNRDVMHDPKVHVAIGDAREVLLTTPRRYDIVFSEPSNPYRAGIASLFTREYYEAIASRLEQGGIFLQWVQAYNVDAQAVRTIYATLATVFPVVETWELAASDLLLVGSRETIVYDVGKLRARIAEEPYRTALASAWRAVDVEGVLGHYVARSSLAGALRDAERGHLNTDDRTLVEFGFARTAGDKGSLSSADIRRAARARGEHRPADVVGEMDYTRVDDEWTAFLTAEEDQDNPFDDASPDQKTRAKALGQYLSDQPAQAVATWRSQPREPRGPTETAALAEAMASTADDRARPSIEKLRAFEPTEAELVLARLLVRQHKPKEAAAAILRGFALHHADVWPWPVISHHAFDTLEEIAGLDPSLAPSLYGAILSPLPAYVQEDRRVQALLSLAQRHTVGVPCAETLRLVEPHVPWTEELLSWRARCYGPGESPDARRARAELAELLASRAQPFKTGLWSGD
jgi:spermidine synthase